MALFRYSQGFPVTRYSSHLEMIVAHGTTNNLSLRLQSLSEVQLLIIKQVNKVETKCKMKVI